MQVNNNELFVVGVGASAGGLDALQQLFDHTPDDTGMAFIIIQHLSPDFVSLMPELLSKHTNMKIFTAEDKQTIEPNCIYLNQRNKNLHIKGRELYLLDKGPKHNLNLPIDIFFNTLGEEYKEKSVGVILSGTGSDGSRGIKSIKEGGGVVMVQDPVTAQFDGMPNSAISTNHIDLILDPESIGATFSKLPISNINLQGDDSKSNESLVTSILSEILKFSGIDFRGYKKNTLLRRLEKRMNINNIDKLHDYLIFLKTNDSEKEALKQDFLIGVTRFFRDEAAFQTLKNKVVPTICQSKNGSEAIRVWVSGCSTGEEVYSIAILFDEYISRSKLNLDYKIFATDVDLEALEIAGKGAYHINTINELNKEYLDHYFLKEGDKIKIIKRIRDKIVFSNHNLLKDPPFIRMDLISCRNLLIYLESKIQAKIIQNFQFSLVKHGFLFLGSSESLGMSSVHFNTIDSKWKMYQNIVEGKPLPLQANNNEEIASLSFTNPDRGLRTSRRVNTIKESPEAKFHKLISSSFGPDAIVIDKEYNILFINGNAGQRLTISSGVFERNLIKTISSKIATLVRNGIRRLEKEQKTILIKDIVHEKDGTLFNFDLTLKKLQNEEFKDLYILLFSEDVETKESALVIKDFPLDEITKQQTIELESELQATKAELQNVVEELETSNEELQSSNEELMASNEELQSTNEELQSVNEELYTVNSELQEKNKELQCLNNDVNNLLESTDIGTLFLDSELRIRKFTPSLKKHFNLEETDIGRPISSFVSSFNEKTRAGIVQDIERALERLETIEKEVFDNDGNYFLKRTSPFVTADKTIDGVVVTFVNINQLVEAKEKLKDSETKFKSIFQNAGVAITTVSSDGKPMLMNDEFPNFLGYSKTELKKMSFAEFTHPDDVDIDVEKYQQLLKNEIRSYKLEKRYYRKDGKIVWGLLTVTSVVDDNGKFLYGIGIVKDITDRKQFEERLSEEKRFTEKVAETSTLGIYVYNFEKGINTFTNKQYEKLLGYTQDEINGLDNKGFMALFHPDDIQDVQDHMNQLKNGEENVKLEYRFKQKDGAWKWVYSVDTPFEIDENGKVMSFLGSFIDLSEIKAFEEQLALKNRELNKAQQISKVGSWYMNIATNEVTWTEELYKMYGFDPSLPVPPYAEHIKLFTPESWELLSKALDKTAKEGIPYELELEMVKVNNQKGWMWVYGEAIKNEDGEIFALWGAAQDVTERVARNNELKVAKKLAESANLLKNNFLANMSHEIRTPLNGITGFADLLRNEDLKEEDKIKFINIIDNNSDQLLNLIDDIIDVAKIESDDLTIVKRNCALGRLLDDLELNFNQIAKTKNKTNISFKAEVPTKLKDLVVETDCLRLRQVLVNLLNNAFKFTDKGVISFGFTTNKSEINFFVKDEGVGIPEDKLDEIFERFKQVNYDNNVVHGGTGLGLAICKGIIVLLGGKISVKSKLNVGTEFMFTIPLKLENTENKNEEIGEKEKGTAKSDKLFENKTILIVEDEELVRMYFEETFKNTEAKILLAENGKEAVSLFSKNPEIDVVLMDIRMPRMNGFEAMGQILEIDPKAIIIAQTAFVMTEEREECMERGCKGYLSKPIKKKELFDTIERWT